MLPEHLSKQPLQDSPDEETISSKIMPLCRDGPQPTQGYSGAGPLPHFGTILKDHPASEIPVELAGAWVRTELRLTSPHSLIFLSAGAPAMEAAP